MCVNPRARFSVAFSTTIAVVLSLAIAVSATRADAQTRAMSFVDSLELPVIQDPQLSPDGKAILFVLDSADWKANRRVGHVYRVDAKGGPHVQLTFGERGETSPRWSPDGASIAFLARRDGDEHNQIYLLEAAGGEARRVTKHATAPSSLTWSHDGKAIWFLASDAPTDEEKEKKRLQDDVYAFEETNYEQRHLWTATLDGKTTKISDGAFSVSQYEVNESGTRVAMLRTASPLLEHLRTAEVWLSDVDGRNATRVTTNDVAESGPMISPDGATVLFTAGANDRFEPYYNDKIFVAPAAGGAARLLLKDPPYEVENVQWAPDGKTVYFTANLGVHNELMRADVASGAVTPLTTGEHNLGAWSYVPSASMHVFTMNTATRPAEVYTLPAAGGQPTRVTSVFDFVAQKYTVAKQERFTWKGQDGQTVEGLLFYPLDYRAGQRYPLIIATHGGPASSDRFGFAPESQVYAGKGYAVLKPNYRGSTGYGDAFLRDMVKGYFKQAHLDVLAAADALVAKGIADPAKLVKMGWSAGGHMTNKIITFTDRFKVASSGAGVANWISMYAQSDHREFRTPWFGGTPWQKDAPIDLYWEHSPLRHVANVKTPTLFLVGEADPRVPLPQSIEMYRALHTNGVPTRLFVAPREGHGWTELRHRLFKLQIEMEWFEKWVFDRAYTWERAPGDGKKEEKTTTAQP
jgi:dipeptidyl aminopeptidase/acylaminoacyl peptidase